ncbi:MAG TPA: hypothetical protein VM051_06020 [Usitatibacter sp.]|nr:hypothetical protein [Usitatibacter sp.]
MSHPQPNRTHPKLPRDRKPEPPPGTPEHEEWLLDEAAEESFPASDAASTVQPGGTLAVNKMSDVGRETPTTEENLKNKDE